MDEANPENSLQRQKAIFLAANDIGDAEERAAFLARECGGDDDLRCEVERILAAGEDAPERFLATEVLPGRPWATTERTENTVGPYELVEKLGEGAFGVVFRAIQEVPVKREVALKIIKPGMDCSEVVRRFEAERQALAIMDHPSIAQVYDAGTTELGRPYFVMELVRGVPITDYCKDHKLPIRQRLELLIKVCEAVQHAHLKGVIHRDLKPSNILVVEHEGKALPKVIDFGIAKAIDQETAGRTVFTAEGRFIGTPQYMSPEQAGSAADIDTRADVYALGVVLYELLTGSPPLTLEQIKNAAWDELARFVRESEPPRPSRRITAITNERSTDLSDGSARDLQKIARRLRGELDWIVMRALEKEPERRYETPSSFASDLGCYLSNQPIAARPPSKIYKTRKFVARYPVPVLLAVLLLGILIAGIIGIRIQLERALVAESDRAKEASRATQAADKAAAQLRRSERMLYATKMTSASRLIEQGEPWEALAQLRSIDPAQRNVEFNLAVRLATRNAVPGPDLSRYIDNSPYWRREEGYFGLAEDGSYLVRGESSTKLISSRGVVLDEVARTGFIRNGVLISNGKGVVHVTRVRDGRFVHSENALPEEIEHVWRVTLPDEKGRVGMMGMGRACILEPEGRLRILPEHAQYNDRPYGFAFPGQVALDGTLVVFPQGRCGTGHFPTRPSVFLDDVLVGEKKMRQSRFASNLFSVGNCDSIVAMGVSIVSVLDNELHVRPVQGRLTGDNVAEKKTFEHSSAIRDLRYKTNFTGKNFVDGESISGSGIVVTNDRQNLVFYVVSNGAVWRRDTATLEEEIIDFRLGMREGSAQETLVHCLTESGRIWIIPSENDYDVLGPAEFRRVKDGRLPMVSTGYPCFDAESRLTYLVNRPDSSYKREFLEEKIRNSPGVQFALYPGNGTTQSEREPLPRFAVTDEGLEIDEEDPVQFNFGLNQGHLGAAYVFGPAPRYREGFELTAVSSDGRFAAFRRGERTAVVSQLNPSEMVFDLPGEEIVTISNDGHRAVAGSEGSDAVRLLDITGAEPQEILVYQLHPSLGGVRRFGNEVVFSHDGKRLFVGGRSITILDTEFGFELMKLLNLEGSLFEERENIRQLLLSPNGDSLRVISGHYGGVSLIDLRPPRGGDAE